MTHRKAARLRKVELHKVNQPVRLFAYIQDSTDWTQWRARTVTFRTAEQMVVAGEAERITRKMNGAITTMYRATKPTQPSNPSQATLTMATSWAVAANATGARLTKGEAAHVAKFILWPLEGDCRNKATVRAGTHADRIRAEKFLESVQRPRGREYRQKPRPMSLHDCKPVPVAA